MPASAWTCASAISLDPIAIECNWIQLRMEYYISRYNCSRELKLPALLPVTKAMIAARFEVYSSKHSGVAKLHPLLCIDASICMDMCQCHVS